MTIFDKVIEIFKNYYICLHCLGRCFAMLATESTNLERGKSLLMALTMEMHEKFLSNKKENEKEIISTLKILAEKAQFIQSQKLLENEGIEISNIETNEKCYLCQGIFDDTEKYIINANELVRNIEFNNFLCGTRPSPQIINRADNFKSKFSLLNSEAFKSHFNREIGKKLSIKLNKQPNFENPNIVFVYSIDFQNFNVELIIRSLFIAGRYQKLIRGIPQTRWICKNCLGNGCDLCNNTGKKYEISIEELMSPEFVKAAQASDSKFHGAGREDIDVRMLGNGRPFILELRSPMVRSLDLDKIMEKINQINQGKIKICDLRYSSKKEVIYIKEKAESTKKTYKSLVESPKDLNVDDFNHYLFQLKEKLENQKISQRTPKRVSHRRADLLREKKIYRIDGQYLKPNLFEFIIETQGGTYIKELINGDNGRTKPSLTEIFEIPLVCKELDVINVE